MDDNDLMKSYDKIYDLKQKGEYQKALDIYELIQSENESSVRYRLMDISKLYNKIGDTSNAIVYYNKWANSESYVKAEDYRYIGELLETIGEKKLAAESYLKALQINHRVGVKKKYFNLTGKEFIYVPSKIVLKQNHIKGGRKNRDCENWAVDILQNINDYVILDTETTGLNKNGIKDVAIEIAIINISGDTLFNQKIKPNKLIHIPSDATNIHKIKIGDLKNKPSFKDVSNEIQQIIENKIVLIYNASYDVSIITNNIERDEVEEFRMSYDCVMLEYSKFVGDWSEYWNKYTFQRLPGGNHTALGDCIATLNVIKKMAGIQQQVNRKWWQFWH